MKDRLDTDSQADSGAQSIFSLLRAAHALEDKVESILASAGLSGPKFAVLGVLVAAKEALPLGELADRLSCVKSNATQMIDRLEADGLVRRIPDPNDRRSVRAEVTQRGRERHAAGAEAMEALEARFSDAVEAEDRSAVARMLRSIEST
jgi:DNA-binding MarR family transcriptional regulator